MTYNLSNSFNIRKEESKVFVQLLYVLDWKVALHGPLMDKTSMPKKKMKRIIFPTKSNPWASKKKKRKDKAPKLKLFLNVIL